MAAKSLARCTVAPAGRRNIFWATQPDACGTAKPCPDHGLTCNCSSTSAVTCGRPGLALIDVADPCYAAQMHCYDPCRGTTASIGKTIANDNWVDGLIYNILGTDARRPDDECGYLPGQRGGHWSDSFRGDNYSAGTKVRYVNPKCSVSEMTTLIEAALNDDLQKLVGYGVVHTISAAVTYRGNNMLHADITYTGTRGDNHRVGIDGVRLKNAWAWGTQRVA